MPNVTPPASGAWIPPVATFGGKPDKKIDVGVSAFFLALFAIMAVVHMGTFLYNKSRNRFFVFSAVTFGFCMSRIVTFAMRIAWAKNPDNANIAIAAQVFISAGVVLLYVVNLIFAQRIMGSQHPTMGRSKAVKLVFGAYYASIVLVLAMVITVTVQSFYSRSTHTQNIDITIRKVGTVWFTVFAFMATPVTLLAILVPSKSEPAPLGVGSLWGKVVTVIVASVLLTLGIALRTGIGFLPRRWAWEAPLWYHRRATFYVFLPTLEILVVILYAAMRIDKRFYLEGKAEKRIREKSEKEGESSLEAQLKLDA